MQAQFTGSQTTNFYLPRRCMRRSFKTMEKTNPYSSTSGKPPQKNLKMSSHLSAIKITPQTVRPIEYSASGMFVDDAPKEFPGMLSKSKIKLPQRVLDSIQSYKYDSFSKEKGLQCCQCYEKYDVASHQKYVGERVSEIWNRLGEKHSLNVHVSGILPLIHFSLEYENPLAYKTYFTQEMLKRGFLAAMAVYTSYAHTDETIELYEKACDEIFAQISDIIRNGENILDKLEGPVCHAGFERLN